MPLTWSIARETHHQWPVTEQVQSNLASLMHKQPALQRTLLRVPYHILSGSLRRMAVESASQTKTDDEDRLDATTFLIAHVQAGAPLPKLVRFTESLAQAACSMPACWTGRKPDSRGARGVSAQERRVCTSSRRILQGGDGASTRIAAGCIARRRQDRQHLTNRVAPVTRLPVSSSLR